MDRERVAHPFDGSRLWVSRAVAVVFLLGLPFLLHDLWVSVHEHRVLRAGVMCGASTVDCLAEEDVTLGPRNDSRRTRMVDWYVRGVGEGPDDSDLVHLLPADDRTVLGFGPSAVAYRVDGTVVALSRTPTSERVPIAWDGTHGALLDGFLVAFVLATYDALVWTLAGLFVAATWWGPAVNRRILAPRAGRHAA